MDPWAMVMGLLGWGALAIIALLLVLVLVVLVQAVVGALRPNGSGDRQSKRTDVENSHTIFRSGDRE